MGGKNKKHKAPGAAAVRAAVSASRARSAEAGAVGEAQSKKPVARPAPAVPTSSREPRVKQGMPRSSAQAYALSPCSLSSRGLVRAVLMGSDLPHTSLLAVGGVRGLVDRKVTPLRHGIIFLTHSFSPSKSKVMASTVGTAGIYPELSKQLFRQCRVVSSTQSSPSVLMPALFAF